MKSNLDFVLEDLHGIIPNDHYIFNSFYDIKNACLSAINVLDDILNLESIDAGSFHVDLKYEKLIQTFETIVRPNKVFALQKEIALKIINSLPSNARFHRFFLVDNTKLQQVVRNLIVNAVKFTPAGGTITVKLLETTSSTTSLPFIDHSSGIHKRNSKIVEFQKDEISSYLSAEQDLLKESFPLNEIVIPGSTSTTTSSDNGHGHVNDRTPLTLSINNNKPPAVKPLRVSALLNSYTLDTARFTRVNDIIIEVTDSGAGISAENMNKVFGEFSQFNAKELQGGGGSGLGLWICKEIVKQHGGIIGCYSDGPGQGSTFFVQLHSYKDVNVSPSRVDSFQDFDSNSSTYDLEGNSVELGGSSLDYAVTSSLYASQSHSQSHSNVSTPKDYNAKLIKRIISRDEILQPFRRSPRVLIVDDSSVNRKVLVKIMQRLKDKVLKRTNGQQILDFVTVEADDGRAAVELVQHALQSPQSVEPFHVVFMDNIMLHLHGPQATKQMRQLGYNGRIIGVTGNVMECDMKEFCDAGADFILKKPLKVEDVERILLDAQAEIEIEKL